MLGTLLGNYRIVQQLGQGGMGVVYVGRHEALGHRVVVKVAAERRLMAQKRTLMASNRTSGLRNAANLPDFRYQSR